MNRFLRFILFTACLFSGAYSRAQDGADAPEQHDCGNRAIVVASNQYDIGKFIECVEGLKACIKDNGFDYNEKVQAYRLSAMCYLAIDSLQEANKCIEKLLTIDDNFELDVRDPQRFRLQVAYIRTQLRANLTSSVSKKMENIDMAPATIQIISAKDIQDRGYTDLESVFNDLPGFDITRNFGISYSVLYQRGYRSPALTERTMIMIDGIEDNDLWTNAAFITKQYPLSSVKRVEVIYGPASTIYGANAFCGVINIVTKDEDDIFSGSNGNGKGDANGKPKNVAINLQTGAASYNTKYVDGTISARSKNVFFSVTGRMYMSDGIDQSGQSYWDGVPEYAASAYTSKMTMPYSADSATKYVGTYFKISSDSAKIIPTAAGIKRADSLDKAFYKTAKKNAGVFGDPIKDFYVSAKLAVNNFKFGFQFWNKNEGSAGDYVDNYASPNSAYTNWQVREYFLYARYDKKISEQVNLSSLTYYRYCDFGNDSRVATFSGYGNGGISDYGFMHGVTPKFNSTNYYEASNLVSSELKSTYVINDKFDAVVGSEFRTGILQANYLTSPLNPAVFNGHAPDSAGGNNFASYTISGYATASYHNTAHRINVDLGGRVDNNGFRLHQGYGTVYNPRVDVVYYPGSFIFKAIYAEAFLDASNQNKFSTASSRLLNNPTLEPEKVKNFELTGRYKFAKKNYVEIALYRADYTHSLALVQVTLPNKVITHQYQDIGQSLVYGAQAASEVFVGDNISVYSNVTYTDAESIFKNIKGKDSIVRTGDIAMISGNAGVNISFFEKKLTLNTRLNMVGDKPTGLHTSVNANPFTKVSAYGLLNATLGYRIIKDILLQVSCNNILDRKYYSPGVRTADGSVYAPVVLQPGRNYVARLVIDLKK
jgi:outer membrane receptor for ferrienterochelin and colicins